MLGALLAIASSFGWGAANFLAGLESRRRSVWTVTAVSQVASALSAVVLLLFAGDETLNSSNAIWAVVAGVCLATAVVALHRALALGTMSVIAPIVSAQVAVPVAVGLALGERPSAAAWIGMVLAAAGVAVASRDRDPHAAPLPRAALLLALLSTFMYGVVCIALDNAGDGSPLSSAFVVRVASAALLLAYFFASRRRLDCAARDLPTLASIGVLMTVATALVTVAFTMGMLSIVSVLGSLSPGITLGIAQVVLSERLSRQQWAGVAAVLIGALLLTL